MYTPHINHFNLAKYQFRLTATSKIKLPPFAGSILRGAFSAIFKKKTCTKTEKNSCFKCENQQDCIFFQIFENSDEFSSLQLSRFKTPPKPFIFEFPTNSVSQVYAKDQEILCNLLLIGRAIKELPLFVATFREVGQQGIGNGSGTFLLKEVHGQHILTDEKQLVYSDASGVFIERDLIFQLNDLLQLHQTPRKNLKKIRIEFLTPTRIKSSGSFGNPLNFKVLIQTLLTRISNIAYSYCDQTQLLNFRNLVNLAQKVEVVTENKPGREGHRFTEPTNLEMFLGGYVGEIIYSGEMAPFWPWLKAGEVIHLGKNSAFGLGQYVVTAVDE
jgi:hypothetical protein